MSVGSADLLAALRANPFVQVSTGDQTFWWLGGHEIELTPEYEWRLAALALRLAAAGGLDALRAQEQQLWEVYSQQGVVPHERLCVTPSRTTRRTKARTVGGADHE